MEKKLDCLPHAKPAEIWQGLRAEQSSVLGCDRACRLESARDAYEERTSAASPSTGLKGWFPDWLKYRKNDETDMKASQLTPKMTKRSKDDGTGR